MIAKAAAGLWLVVLLAAMSAVSARTQAAARAERLLLAPVPLSQLNPRLINLLSLGYRALYDDFIDIWLVQILVGPETAKASAADLAKVVLQATRHQPRLESAYMLPCFVLAFDLKHPEYCDSIIQDGLKALPQSWRLPATAGYIAAFKVKDPGRAAVYYELASTRPKAPGYLHDFAQRLAAKNELTGAEREEAMAELLQIPGGDGPEVPAMKMNLKRWGSGE